MKNLYLLLVVLICASSCTTSSCPAYSGSKNVQKTHYYQTFLEEGMAGKKDKSGYKYKKKPSRLVSLISL